MIIPLIAGGIAGTTVDIVLFPLDTIKTRLQSKDGFRASGGFRGVYAGILPAATGSAPSAATFFLVYEVVKSLLATYEGSTLKTPFVHMFAASTGEIVSNLVRVPFEVTKQRIQAKQYLKPMEVVKSALLQEGVRGLYRGYFSVIYREIPFSVVQYPLWEYLKQSWSRSQNHPVMPWQSAIAGALAGGTAALVTTPLDVAKTRIMLAEKSSEDVQRSYMTLLRSIYKREGIRGLFAGGIARVLWISFGGFVFLGSYSSSSYLLDKWIKQ